MSLFFHTWDRSWCSSSSSSPAFCERLCRICAATDPTQETCDRSCRFFWSQPATWGRSCIQDRKNNCLEISTSRGNRSYRSFCSKCVLFAAVCIRNSHSLGTRVVVQHDLWSSADHQMTIIILVVGSSPEACSILWLVGVLSVAESRHACRCCDVFSFYNLSL